MIATLSGILFSRQPDQVIIDVGGVGYEVLVSRLTFDSLPEQGGEVFLHIHTNVREDAIVLFGFARLEEKGLFLLLNSVSGVGPKLALGIMSGISAADLCEALSMKNMSRLTALPGVGKKTAERLCMELQEKAGRFYIPPAGTREAAAEKSSVEGDIMEDALSALANLGYPQHTAHQALRKVQQQYPDTVDGMRVEQLIRHALRALAS